MPKKRDAMPEAILECALKLFRAQGFEGTSLREIAERLEVTKAAIYYHFPAKQTLLESLVRPVQDRVDEVLRRPPAAGADERFALFADYLDALIRHRDIIAWLVNDAAALSQAAVGERAQRQMNELRRLLCGGSRRLAEAVAAECAIGALHGSLFTFADRKPEKFREAILAGAMGAYDAAVSSHASA